MILGASNSTDTLRAVRILWLSPLLLTACSSSDATPAATDGLAAAFAGLEAKLAGISKPRTVESAAE